MTMVSNAYKTQTRLSDPAIAHMLIARFTGQLKGWWDNYLSPFQQNEILTSVKTDESDEIIWDANNEDIPDAVATLVFAISQHFVGDPSHLKDKNLELLSNLKYKRLSDFRQYKDTFLTRVMSREDCNQPFWKEKFLAGLPTLLGEQVRNEIKSINHGQIPYKELSYGELISFIHKEESSSNDEEGLQMDELNWSSDEKSINVLTKDQEFLLEIADQIQNPLLRKQYLEKLKQGNLDGETKTPNYNLSEILKRHDKRRAHKTSFDAQKEFEILRNEIDCLKFEQQQHSTIIRRLEELFTEAAKPSASSDHVLMNQDKNPEETLALDQTKNDQHETLTMVGELSPNRWLIKITLVINHNLFMDATALFDTGADENCISEQFIPARFYEKTTESLSSVSGTKLDI
ncbi:hypothetical protein CRG98_008123 [Punica granatum]|uniref:Peptidase A2 domain-containing protein n=1 Tax=Punica granatum TaxID=22663 RepID=A0A2I0KSY2_PUNGR|nr:hypothetical protein CRG98_008123 [Punica granatum]